jgi:DNA (cytosine-5)-methyltransferase 1
MPNDEARTQEIRNFRLGELFCGPGGIALGALRARVVGDGGTVHAISHAWANDYDKDTCETYRRNICPTSPRTVVQKDVREFSPEEAQAISNIDGLAFGFPCNDYSLVGEQKGMDGVYGPLYSYGVRMLSHFKPSFFLAENVGGISSANEGNAFVKILGDLFAQGYNLVPHLYKFEQYGVPQNRHRIIIVGIRSDIGVKFHVPVPFDTPEKTARQALEQPPIPASATNQEQTAHSAQVVERLRHIKADQNVWNAEMPAHLRLNVIGATMSQIYRRLHPDKPAYTVTGSGGGGTHVYHWSEDRALTNRERARLQTFPDDYVFVGQKESVRKQIGMAVPPDGAHIVFDAILKTFASVEYPHCPPNITPFNHSDANGANLAEDQLRFGFTAGVNEFVTA